MNLKTYTGAARGIEFMDKNNFAASYRSGVWTMQHYHTKSSLEALLKKYFAKVQVSGKRTSSQIYAVASDPLPLDKSKVEQALNTEFNMEYPNGYRHNRHKEIVSTIMSLNNDLKNWA